MKIIFNQIDTKDITVLAKAFRLGESFFAVTDKGVEIEIPELEVENFHGFYQILKNENLHSLSKKFMLSESILEGSNQGLIFAEGVTIYVPKILGKRYVVTPADTLSGIAAKNRVTVEELKKRNNISFIYAGQVLVI